MGGGIFIVENYYMSSSDEEPVVATATYNLTTSTYLTGWGSYIHALYNHITLMQLLMTSTQVLHKTIQFFYLVIQLFKSYVSMHVYLSIESSKVGLYELISSTNTAASGTSEPISTSKLYDGVHKSVVYR